MLQDKLIQVGAIQSGHFILSSGLHSNSYVQCAKVTQYPYILREAIEQLDFNFGPVDCVIGPAYGGIVIAHYLAEQLGCRALFTERDNLGNMVLRRNQELNPGDRVLVADDVLTTGRSLREVLPVLERADATPVGFTCLIDRYAGPALELPVLSVVKLDFVTYDPADCPLCKQNIPVIKPGSRVSE